MQERFGLRLRIFLFFALLALGGVAAIGAGLWVGYQRLGEPQAASAFVLAGTIGGLGLLGLTAWIWLLFDENLAKPIMKLSGILRTRAHAGVGEEIDLDLARYLGDLGPAARAVTSTLVEGQGAVDDEVAKSTAGLAGENARLQALLADVPASIVMATSEHRVVFYNGAAAGLFGGEDTGPQLGRSLFDSLRAGPVRAAYDRLLHDGVDEAETGLLCATRAEGRQLHGRMRLMARTGADDPAYVLTFRDLAGELSLPGEDGAEGLTWPVTTFTATSLADAVKTEFATRDRTIETSADPLDLSGDPVQLTKLLAHLADRLAGTGARSFSLLIDAAEQRTASVTFGWAGEEVAPEALDRWLRDDLDPGITYLSGAAVLTLHRSAADPRPARAGRAALRFTVPLAQEDNRPGPRRAVFDFNLAAAALEGAETERPLRDLAFVVFDSETTGLEPDNGDEIVQIAAVRMMGGKIVEGEAFDTLVDPERSIPAASTKVHRIDETMVQGAPTIDAAGRRFHRFAEGAVLVAHNAPFDMAFLRRHEARIGRVFDHPVMDTVLLSAILFGRTEHHSLDALTARLGVSLPDELRHTAMGDARATAEALERMIPMLEEMGYGTLGRVIEEARRHRGLIEDLN